MDLSHRILAAATSAQAAPQEASREPSDRSEQFVAVSGSESEQVNASVMVVAAYSVFWLLAIVFVFLTYRSQSRLRSRVAELESRISKQSTVTKDFAP